MRRIVGGGKLFIAGAAVLMAALVIGTLLAINALLGHALSPSFNANAPGSVQTPQPAAAPNLQVITPAAIAPTPAVPILVYSPPAASQPIVVSDGTVPASLGTTSVGATPVRTTHPTSPSSAVAAKAPGDASGTSVSTSGAPASVATAATGSTVAGGVAPGALPVVPVVSTAPGVTPPPPSPTPPGPATAAAGPNTNLTSTNTNTDWSLRHRR